MQLTEQEIMEYVQQVRAFHPTVHCITNIVTVNDCANVVHAVGASPVMAHHPMETGEVAANCDALVCNMGAIDDFEAMAKAVVAAKAAGKPIVIDPVGVGGITYRRGKCKELLELAAPTCIRGNASEIRALVEDVNTTVGVDANEADYDITRAELELRIVEMQDLQSGAEKQKGDMQIGKDRNWAKILAEKYHCIVVVSGATDFITDGEHDYYVEAGDEMMTRITGTGCMSSVLIGALLGAACKVANVRMHMSEIMEIFSKTNEDIQADSNSMVKAVVASCEMMGSCGERAAEYTRENGAGTMSFHNKLIDEISVFQLLPGSDPE